MAYWWEDLEDRQYKESEKKEEKPIVKTEDVKIKIAPHPKKEIIEPKHIPIILPVMEGAMFEASKHFLQGSPLLQMAEEAAKTTGEPAYVKIKYDEENE